MKDKKDSDKDSSEKITPGKFEKTENEEDPSEEETSEIPEWEQEKTRKLKLSTFFKTILLLLLIGTLSWTIYYLHNTIQNNLVINNKIKETVEEIYRIQAEQDEIKGTIKSFQNDRDALDKLLITVNKLNRVLSGLQDDVKFLQVEINKKPDFLPPSKVQVQVPSQMSQPAKLEIKKEAEMKEESVLIEKSEVKEEPEVKEESRKDVRNKVINSIEDTAGNIFQKTGDAFKWIKEKIF